MLTASNVAKNHFLFDSPTTSGRSKTKNNRDRPGETPIRESESCIILDLDAVAFTVHLKDGRTVTIDGATSYQPEGPLTTFFSSGSTRQALDSWATRLASYRTVDIVSIERTEAAAVSRKPVLVAA